MSIFEKKKKSQYKRRQVISNFRLCRATSDQFFFIFRTLIFEVVNNQIRNSTMTNR